MTDRLPHEKGFHVSWDQMHRDSRALASAFTFLPFIGAIPLICPALPVSKEVFFQAVAQAAARGFESWEASPVSAFI